jgi:hypothetical protein
MSDTGLTVALPVGTAVIVAIGFALALVFGVASAPSPRLVVGEIEVRAPFAYESIPGRPNSAAYMTLVNQGAEPVRLLAAESPVAGVTELHSMEMAGDVMRMRRIEGGIELLPGVPYVLAPGGDHIMLMQLGTSLRPGATAEITLTFDGHPPVTVPAPVLARGT